MVKKQGTSLKQPVIMIPYVEKVSDSVTMIMKKYNISVVMKP